MLSRESTQEAMSIEQNSPIFEKRSPVRLVDVAKAAGVSRWAAGYVLNGGVGRSRVSNETASRIRDVAHRLNYQPHFAARQLRGKRSRTLGVLVASAGDPLRSFLVQYLDAEAVKVGCRTFMANTIGNPSVGPNQFDFHVEQFARRGVDGVLCAVHHWFPGDRAALLDRHPNTVFYESPGIPDAAYVTVGREEAVRIAVRHLIERGRRRIGLAVMDLSRPSGKARLRGYDKELAAHNFATEKRLVFQGNSIGLAYAKCNEETGAWEFPHDKMDRVIDALVVDQKADAIVTHDDFWAASILRRLRARGIRVPEDVALVGYLNHYLADWIDPPLTTVDLQHRVAAQQMIEMVEKMIAGETLDDAERVSVVRPKLIVRSSS